MSKLKLAQRWRRKRGLEKRVRFERKNYFLTGFADETFNHIFGLESFCYAYPQLTDVFAEMYRILKSDGKIIMSDGLLLRRSLNEYEEKLADDMQYGFKMRGWNTPEEIIAAFEKSGFKNVQYIDRTTCIRKSVKDIYRLSILASPLCALRYMGLISRVETEQLLAGNAQKKMYKIGLFGYGIFIAEK